MKYYQQSQEQVLEQLEANIHGLSSAQASERLLSYGPNILQQKKKVSPWTIFFNQFKSPLILILVAATAVSMLIGDVADGIVIIIIVILNALFGFFQEYKAEKSMESLKKMMSLRSKILRDGSQILIDSSEVVPGDIVMLEEGDKIPADGYLLRVSNLETAEAVLTGESLPVKKDLLVIDHDVVLGDQKNMVFSGTTVTK
jgi:Ca2+-transporting ATPase